MSCYSLHTPLNRWLSSFQKGAEAGSEHTISVGHPLCGGEFTTYRLGPVVAANNWGDPLFDLDDAEINILQGAWPRQAVWVKVTDVRAAIEAHREYYGTLNPLTIAGHTFKPGVFGGWRLLEAT